MSSQTRAPTQTLDTSTRGSSTAPGVGTEGGGGNDQASLEAFSKLMDVLLAPQPEPKAAHDLFGELAPIHRAMVLRDRNLMPKLAAALNHAADPSKEAEQEEGWGAWLGSMASGAMQIAEDVNPAFALTMKVVETVVGGGASSDKGPGAAPSPTPEVAAPAAPAAPTPASPAKPAAPAAPPKFIPRAVPAAAAPVEGMGAIDSDSLAAAEAYLPEYDADGNLIGGIGKYGFGESAMINDNEQRHWTAGTTSEDGREWAADGPERGKKGDKDRAEKDAARAEWDQTHADGMTQIWCSGLSSATLADLGYPLDDAIPGQFYWENGTKKNLTLRMVVEGMPEALAQTEEQDKFVSDAVEAHKIALQAAADAEPDPKKKAKILAGLEKDPIAKFRAATLYSLQGNFGDTAAADDARVKGAAGAFELAGIGRELDDLTQVRPGDFCQHRDVGAPKGHAYQLHSIVATGDVLIGAGGSPELITPSKAPPEVQADGTELHVGAVFRMTGATNPNTVRSAKATKWSAIESNTPGSVGKAETERGIDKEGDGGVMVRDDRKLPDDPSSAERHYYAGRLATSPWYASESA